MKTRMVAWSLVGLSCAWGGDWVLSDYAIDAADSLSVAKHYGIQTFKNKASSASATVGGGVLSFHAKYVSEDTEGYTANVGLLHPLTPDWMEHEISSITGVSFEYKNSAKITDALTISFGSDLYTDAIANAGMVHQHSLTSAAALEVSPTWKTASLDIFDFNPSRWVENGVGYPKLDSVLKRVKNIQFTPKTLYTADGTQAGKACTKCVGPDMSAITLEIRNVTLKGVDKVKWSNSTNLCCEAALPATRIRGFSVRASEGVLSLSGLDGIKSFEVVTLDGKKVASFAPAVSVALSLPRGSYFLVGKSDGTCLTKPFAIVR